MLAHGAATRPGKTGRRLVAPRSRSGPCGTGSGIRWRPVRARTATRSTATTRCRSAACPPASCSTRSGRESKEGIVQGLREMAQQQELGGAGGGSFGGAASGHGGNAGMPNLRYGRPKAGGGYRHGPGTGDGGPEGAFNPRQPDKPGTYRPQYKLSDADLSDYVVNTVNGEATSSAESIDAVINNMMNRVGSKGWGPSGNLARRRQRTRAVRGPPSGECQGRRAHPRPHPGHRLGRRARQHERVECLSGGVVPWQMGSAARRRRPRRRRQSFRLRALDEERALRSVPSAHPRSRHARALRCSHRRWRAVRGPAADHQRVARPEGPRDHRPLQGPAGQASGPSRRRVDQRARHRHVRQHPGHAVSWRVRHQRSRLRAMGAAPPRHQQRRPRAVRGRRPGWLRRRSAFLSEDLAGHLGRRGPREPPFLARILPPSRARTAAWGHP